MHPLKVL